MIRINIFNAHPKYRIRHAGTTKLAQRVLKGESWNDATINIIFVNDKTMVTLNEQYLHHSYATDVISFSLGDKKQSLEGEVYIDLDQAKRNASEYRVTFAEEYSRLIVHGILHIIGYRDDSSKNKQRMTKKENIFIGIKGY